MRHSYCSDGGAERGSASWSGIRSDVLVISNSRRLNLGVRRTILYSLDVCRCVLVREIVLYRVDLTISLFRMFLGICGNLNKIMCYVMLCYAKIAKTKWESTEGKQKKLHAVTSSARALGQNGMDDFESFDKDRK